MLDLENYPTSTFAIKLSSLNIRDTNHSKILISQQVNEIANLAEETGSKLIIDAEELEINDFSREKITATENELKEEKSMVSSLLP